MGQRSHSFRYRPRPFYKLYAHTYHHHVRGITTNDRSELYEVVLPDVSHRRVTPAFSLQFWGSKIASSPLLSSRVSVTVIQSQDSYIHQFDRLNITRDAYTFTNDDGPPSAQASPYILAFVNALEKTGHTVSVIVPNTQRSWIGKAHIVGQDIQTTFYFPPKHNPETHVEGYTEKDNGSHPWVLVNSTPASCSQLGLNCFFQERGPVDLVISGPNYGRNTSSLFALSSGTLGAALEATQCRYRSIALSFAFTDRTNLPDVVAESCTQGVRVCEWLAANAIWDDSRLYSVNVPVKKGVLQSKISWTKMLQNTWGQGACFQELPQQGAVDDASTEESRLRKEEGEQGSGSATPSDGKWAHRHFKWAPRFADVQESVKKAGPGFDGWAVMEGETSVTSIKANFEHAWGFEGELKL